MDHYLLEIWIHAALAIIYILNFMYLYRLMGRVLGLWKEYYVNITLCVSSFITINNSYAMVTAGCDPSEKLLSTSLNVIDAGV